MSSPSSARQSRSRAQRSTRDLAFDRVYTLKAYAGRMRHLALPLEGDRAKKLSFKAEILMRVAGEGRIYTAVDMHQEVDGEPEFFDGFGSLLSFGLRFDPFYLSRLRRRARKSAQRMMRLVRRIDQEFWKFMTLTVPRVSWLTYFQGIELVNLAWHFMTDRKVWKDFRVRAGCKSIEVAQSVVKGEVCHGPHLHSLIFSSFIDFAKLRQEWTYCLQLAASKLGLRPLPINSQDGLAVCHINTVRPKQKKSQRKVSVDAAIDEICKYVSKSQDFLRMSDEDFLEVAERDRWPRMIEFFGEARRFKAEEAASIQYLDTETLSSGGIGERVLASLVLLRKVLEIATFRLRRRTTQEYRDHRKGLLSKLRWVMPRGKWREWCFRARAPSLYELLPWLSWEKCVQELDYRTDEMVKYRKAALSVQFPYAKFRTLGGEEFSLDDVDPRTVERIAREPYQVFRDRHGLKPRMPVKRREDEI